MVSSRCKEFLLCTNILMLLDYRGFDVSGGSMLYLCRQQIHMVLLRVGFVHESSLFGKSSPLRGRV